MARWNPFSRKKKTDETPKSDPVQTPEQTSKPAAPAPPVSAPEAPVPEAPAPTAPVSEPAVAENDTPAPVAEVKSEKPEEKPAKKRGILGFLKSGIDKTRKALNTDIRDIFKSEGRIVDDAFLEEVFAALIKTDMGAGPAAKIRDDIKSKFRARKMFKKDLIESAQVTIREIMEQESPEVKMAESGPTVVMVVGVNGLSLIHI